MKIIQYLLPNEYDREKVKTIASLLFKIILTKIKELNQKNIKLGPTDFAIYPVNMFRIAKFKKILLTGDKKGIDILDSINL
jgi:hypothetical protein